MINDPSNAEIQGRRGRAKVDKQFLWDPIAERMTETYSWASAYVPYSRNGSSG